MEGVAKPSTTSSGSGVTDGPSSAAASTEERFADLCKSKLGLDESTTRQAMQLFKETKNILKSSVSSLGGGSPEEIERFWSACVLYCVSRLSKAGRSKEDGSVSLCQILRASKLNIVDFFKEMPQFCLKVAHVLTGLYGSDWEKRLELKELQANVVHLSLLSRHYKRAYQELFLSNDGKCSGNSSELINQEASDYYRFGWLLFLALRIQTFSRFKDLVTSTNELVSVLAVLIIHVPVRLRNFDIKDSSYFAKKSDRGVSLIASLCEKYHTSEDELSKALEKTNTLIMDVLKKKPCPATSACQQDNLSFIDPGLTVFKDFLQGDSLKSSLLILEKEYENAINTKGELDERMFANDEDSLLGSGSLSGGAINLPGTKRKYDVMASPAKSISSPNPMSPPRFCLSPKGSNFCNSKMAPITPVSTAMTTAKWLRSTVSPLPSKPSGELLRFFSACDKDLTDDIAHRAGIILGAIFTSSSFGERICTNMRSANRMDAIWTEQRKMEALKLYYRVLESMCRAESQILSGNNLTSLLSNERFHRCMIACSAELVLATHKTVTMMFPAVLEKTGITAFDLSKVIEGFVRHEDTLPRELKRHLNSLEERLLESMAWEKGSSMYNSLIVARPALSVEINRLGLLAEPMPSLDAIAAHHNISLGGLPPLPFQKQDRLQDKDEVRSPKRACTERRNVLVDSNSFRSPVKDIIKSKLPPPLQSAFASPTRPNPAAGGETCAETGIGVFFSKIAKLAAIRIRSLCERLQLSQQVLERVYSLVQQILSQQTGLFFNRHIDQIILCSIYGVAKISQLELSFKEIIFGYRKQPQCKPQVFRSVYVHWPPRSRNGKTGEDHVDIITFYNEVFIPAVKPLLVEVGPGASPKKKEEEKGSADVGPYPESPRLARFPNLPDMSPKKVSATHNVYVSPLRSSKMDTLLSPSSKSYYACVGESTYAFQSPSKDLKAINNRLNSVSSGKKVNGRLNFDVVSDLVVASSLSSDQNAKPAATEVVPIKTPVKCEPSDS
ncbi:retinoblastoma-related protein 3 isoform X2 [Sorghum bicolor]|uniref:retinoblastoma-related protein 3 isoform X2 n=1 Tax=Sorghum bicolor TaxID=4558 RepID=UPI000B4260F0|nr:retinoblastoma-related protein 3 isoform X2 [Sorghum bicolor]|eukprot:XP_021319936.1 retinoblastoma-related protein 3 isoform X2 [Sorghum bicolor]